MKNTKSFVSTLVLIATLVFLPFKRRLLGGSGAESPYEEGVQDSVEDCKGAFEHLRIAEYYRKEAARLTASSKEHAELAKTYTKSPPYLAMEAKRGDTFGQGASHCNKWSELQAKGTEEAEALATLHEHMAKAAEQKQQ